MYTDTKPCRICGSPVDLEPRTGHDPLRIAEPDDTADKRICTNPDCPTTKADTTSSP